MSQNELKAGHTIEETLHRLGYSEFRDQQKEAIQHLLAGHDAIVVLPTGSGKSLIYELAALHLPGLTLVVSPLIALMQDQVDKLDELGVPATFVNSALSTDEQAERLERMVKGEYKIVYVTPERLRQHFFHEQIQQLEISLLAVDEAHSISEWGHDFRPEYLHIAEFREFVGKPVTVALTATATKRVREEIIKRLQLKNVQHVYGDFDRPNIKLLLETVSTEEDADEAKLGLLVEIFKKRRHTTAIVYVGTRKNAENVASFLQEENGVDAKHYHAGMTAKQRTAVQEAFMAGELPVVVATNAFGMGIDRPDVRLIVHHTMPGSLDAYYQEIGRAGRDGKRAEAILLYNRDDRRLHEHFIRQSELNFGQLKRLYDELVENEDGENGDAELRVVGNKESVGLERLAEADIIEQGEVEGLDHEVRVKAWDPGAVRAEVERIEAYSQLKYAQLMEVIQYAENETECRRTLILQHFDDDPPREVRAGCCDICDAKLEVAEFVAEIERESASESRARAASDQRPALTETILACVRKFDGLRTPAQLVDLLHGDEKGYNIFRRSEYHGKLADYSRDEIQSEIERLTGEGLLKVSRLETLTL